MITGSWNAKGTQLYTLSFEEMTLKGLLVFSGTCKYLNIKYFLFLSCHCYLRCMWNLEVANGRWKVSNRKNPVIQNPLITLQGFSFQRKGFQFQQYTNIQLPLSECEVTTALIASDSSFSAMDRAQVEASNQCGWCENHLSPGIWQLYNVHECYPRCASPGSDRFVSEMNRVRLLSLTYRGEINVAGTLKAVGQLVLLHDCGIYTYRYFFLLKP